MGHQHLVKFETEQPFFIIHNNCNHRTQCIFVLGKKYLMFLSKIELGSWLRSFSTDSSPCGYHIGHRTIGRAGGSGIYRIWSIFGPCPLIASSTPSIMTTARKWPRSLPELPLGGSATHVRNCSSTSKQSLHALSITLCNFDSHEKKTSQTY